MHRQFHPKMVDFSPTEVADLGLVDLQRSAVYNAIKRGDLHATRNERGRLRISQAEIDRYTAARHLERPDFRSKPTDPLLFQAWQRERGRMGGHAKAATHSREEIAAPLQRGKRAWLERLVDPEHILPRDELERRVAAEHNKQMDKARLEKAAKALLRQQYGNEHA